MNSLEKYAQEHAHDPARLMDEIQGQGLVSDNAVTLKDVAERDAKAVVEKLQNSKHDTH